MEALVAILPPGMSVQSAAGTLVVAAVSQRDAGRDADDITRKAR